MHIRTCSIVAQLITDCVCARACVRVCVCASAYTTQVFRAISQARGIICRHGWFASELTIDDLMETLLCTF